MVTDNLNFDNGYRSYCQEVIFLRNAARARINAVGLYADAVCKMTALSEFAMAVRVRDRDRKVVRNP